MSYNYQRWVILVSNLKKRKGLGTLENVNICMVCSWWSIAFMNFPFYPDNVNFKWTVKVI